MYVRCIIRCMVGLHLLWASIHSHGQHVGRQCLWDAALPGRGEVGGCASNNLGQEQKVFLPKEEIQSWREILSGITPLDKNTQVGPFEPCLHHEQFFAVIQQSWQNCPCPSPTWASSACWHLRLSSLLCKQEHYFSVMWNGFVVRNCAVRRASCVSDSVLAQRSCLVSGTDVFLCFWVHHMFFTNEFLSPNVMPWCVDQYCSSVARCRECQMCSVVCYYKVT